MKIYITKWACTLGVIEKEATINGKWARVGPPGRIESQLFGTNEWFESRSDACLNALDRIKRKRGSIEKQLRKLEIIERSL